jgi:flavin-dependent dehydrogenase
MVYDALVIGGGPAGSTAAILLARAGWSVAILEKAAYPRRKVCGEFISSTTFPLLEELGVGAEFAVCAGPEVRNVGLYCGNTMVSAPMPAAGEGPRYGRALGREYLDALLLRRAHAAGAELLQPCTATKIERQADYFVTTTRSHPAAASVQLRSRIVIAAHGSWERGTLPTQPAVAVSQSSDLLAFKAHFSGSALGEDLMPLLAFRSGYGGMVTSDGGHTTLSCCIRRDALARCRRATSGATAAIAVFEHIRRSCYGVQIALGKAVLDDAWLAAGPIRPGIRGFFENGVFLVGNAAAEAHPVVAEGISMAIQSSFLLCRRLVAQLAMRSAAAPIAALLKIAPVSLTFGAAWSGKVRTLHAG